MIPELSIVKLLHDIPPKGLSAGEIGTVVLVFTSPSEAYEVEFGVERNESILATLQPSDLEVLRSGSYHTAEELEAANPGLKAKLSDDDLKFGFSGFKSSTEPSDDLKPCAEGRTHCWHSSPIQHAMMYHRDEVCCRCGQSRCINWMPKTPEGHGSHCPIPR